MTPEELAVVQAAMAYHDKLLANPRALDVLINAANPLTPALSEIARTTWKLATTCPQCNAGGHTCPDDGNDIPHGATDCGEHDENASAGRPSIDTWRQVKGDGSDEEAWLAALLLKTARGGWLNYAKWLDDTEVKLIHTTDGTIRVVADSGQGDVIGEFEVSASARALPSLGPEDDGALRAELAAECDNCAPLRANASVTRVDGTGQDTACVDCGTQVKHAGADGSCPDYGSRLDPCPPGCASGTCVAGRKTESDLIFVLRTWVDVRTGDRVRMPGTDATAHVQSAVHLRWHVKPGTGTSQYNPPVPLEWAGVRVTLDNGITYEMDPAKPIEIEIDAYTASCFERLLFTWADRVGIVIEESEVTLS